MAIAPALEERRYSFRSSLHSEEKTVEANSNGKPL
jgi:hypothetical protein